MKQRIFAAFAALLFVAGQVFAASTLAVTTSNPGGHFTKYSLAWVSHTDGTVSNAFVVRAGSLVQFKFVPGSGAAQPDEAYDVTILDADGFDILAGGGANLSQTTKTLTVVADPRFIEGGTLTLTIAAAGSANGGTVALFIR